MQPPRSCVQRCVWGWYGISFAPGQESEVLYTFRGVTLEFRRTGDDFILIRIDPDSYETFLQLVLSHCHFSTKMYYSAGIVYGPEVG